ncbi:hypothetical protein NIES4075_00740 [Tolypothrix sp. NIES-4075]|uniref:hypothetical protein n=1 Tax=Tolypothrix sp. NIES-4075 TaxID=2005459 RepID=UPI000B6EE8C2|nr:hypothetical protein [Tolypothrix sp. NIES-4075]GAX39123.1 hypothetical protein NIES4075_00740 [Tolypothrix sp. NIES-4075]
MAEIRLAIEGEDAIAATEALLAIPGISGSYKVSAEAPEREGVIATVASIVGIVGGAIAIAEQIRKWYQEYKKPHPVLSDIPLLTKERERFTRRVKQG